jgi:signal transduction histidine kinase
MRKATASATLAPVWTACSRRWTGTVITHDARQRVTAAYERLRALHDDMVDLLARKPRANALLTQCITDAARAAMPARVRTDITSHAASTRVPAALRLVLHHLIQNAVESYARKDRGEVMIRASIQNEHVIVSVVDHGIGIAPTALPQVWSLGYTTKNKLGMGLVLVKRLVESWKGTATITSTPGQGTTIAVRFPMRYEEHPLD